MRDQLASILPALVFVVPAVTGIIVYYLGRASIRARNVVAVLGALATAGIAVAMFVQMLASNAVLTTWGEELRVDGLSMLLVLVISIIGLIAVIYSLRYMRHQTRIHWRDITERRLNTFYCLLMLFIATMLWGVVTNNVLMLYVAVEATTIASGLLVAFYWDRRGLEAGYKYLMLLTTGITFALFGCVLMYAAAAPHLQGVNALIITRIRDVAHLFPRNMVIAISALLIVGFGTKAGIAPFHPWLPDAHAEAPSPVSALLSGVMIKMAVYALIRTVNIFYPTWPTLATFLVSLGAFTMVLGILMAIVQTDIKRLLAYSSVSQMGYILMAFGIGTYLGFYGGVFHLVNHAIYKALLFLAAGAVMYATGIRSIHDLGGLGRKMPITSACFFVGALATSGFPPFNGFMSKITIFLAAADRQMWWAAAIAIATGVLTLVVMVHAAYAIFWGQPRTERLKLAEVKEVPGSIWIPMAVLAFACLVLGVYPQLAFPLLDRAASAMAPASQAAHTLFTLGR
jgi:proton-translocating NADH-quinone oxidoreductase chain N